MRLNKNRNQHKTMPENTIPLINIVFLMLIFFLIAGTVAPPVSPELTPPKAEDLPIMAPAGNAIEILADGSLVHHGERLTLKQVLARFPAPATETPDAINNPKLGQADTTDDDEVVHILADRHLSSTHLMPVLKALRASGHKKIRLITIRGGA